MHMNLAYPCIPYGHKDRYLFTIMNNIIGGNLNSRLFQHVREDKGLSYAIYSYGSAFKQCGLFQIDAAMNPEQTIQVLEAIKEVIGSLFEKAPITEHELHLAKEQIRTELIIDTESTHNHMESNGKALICGRKTVALEDILNAVASVTLEQLSTFMEKYLKAVRPSICLVGDLEQTDISRISAILDTTLDRVFKREFLEDLRKYLSGKLPESTVDGHVAYYRNYIENEIKNGRSEAQVMSGLGDPRMIGRTILDTSPEQQSSGYEYSAYRTDNDGSESQKKRKKSQTGCFFDTSTVFWKNKTGGSSGDYFSCNFRDHSFLPYGF